MKRRAAVKSVPVARHRRRRGVAGRQRHGAALSGSVLRSALSPAKASRPPSSFPVILAKAGSKRESISASESRRSS